MSLKPEPVLSCHCTVAAGLALAAAVKLAEAPAQTIWVSGLVVTTGAVLTVSNAAFELMVPQLLVRTARYCLPLSAATVAKLSVSEVAPGMLLNPEPLLTCHWTVGSGVPVAATVKEAVAPAQTVTLAGCAVTAGPTLTVSVAAVVVDEPQALVKTARY